jgi:hypothetical protein
MSHTKQITVGGQRYTVSYTEGKGVTAVALQGTKISLNLCHPKVLAELSKQCGF